MLITLYNSTADPRDLYKGTQLTQIAIVDAEPYFPVTIETPIFRLAHNASFASINYAYVPEFNRYYFVSKITLESGNAMILSCDCDVLMSFRSDILNLDCICTRNEFEFDEYIQEDIPCSVEATTVNYIPLSSTPFEVPDTENGSYYILNLNGLVGDIE